MRREQLLTNELKIRRRRILNKVFLGFFLTVAISALIMKVVDGVLLDLGWNFNGKEGFHFAFWMESGNYNVGENGALNMDNPNYDSNYSMLSHHPSSLWLLTQFTWITTIIIIILLTFRFFKYDETLPRWLRWVMTQRTLSLITMYDMIVSAVFWGGMFNSFDKAFNGSLRGLELTVTIIVHAIIPFFMLVYSFVYLVKDKKASVLKEMFVYKGMVYPTIYIALYVLVAVVWSDPYAITHIHRSIMTGDNWTTQLWMVAVALVGIWTLLGLMILFHNFILLRFNKHYNPSKDYEITKRKKHKIERIQRRIIRRHARQEGLSGK